MEHPLEERIRMMRVELEQLREEIHEKVVRHDALEIAIAELQNFARPRIDPTAEDFDHAAAKKKRDTRAVREFLEQNGPSLYNHIQAGCGLRRNELKLILDEMPVIKDGKFYRLTEAA